MVEVIGVRYHTAGHIYYFSPNGTKLSLNDKVLVESKHSTYIARVVLPNRELPACDLPNEVKPIVHRATASELQQEAQNKQDAKEAMEIGKEKIIFHKLKMKLVSVEYTFDRSKMAFQFTADGRVDFRELVKDLASVFKTRIELRQIGVRDEAKRLGGIGPCGRPLCCSTFLGDFAPVSIKMAKDQGLSLNPSKISGLCGRLMCCLKYEDDMYAEAKRELPDFGEIVETPDGKGRVVGLNLLSRVLRIRLNGKETAVDYDYDELKGTLKAGDAHVNG